MVEQGSYQVLSALVVTLCLVGGIFLLAKFSPENGNFEGKAPANKPSDRLTQMSAAGSFYPIDKDELNDKLDSLLMSTEKLPTSNPVQILIVPHAGLDYSGQVAASGYKQISDRRIQKVFILASAHFHSFSGAMVNNMGAWETPMGNVQIDYGTAEKIVSADGKIKIDPDAFFKEHPAELQVVWIKKIFPEAKVTPILTGNMTDELINALAYRIAQNWDDKTVLVVSTDLSHYPDYETAVKTDQQTIRDIINGSPEKISQGITGVDTRACGQDPLKIAQKVIELMGWELPLLVRYQNSGDVSGDKSRVVGYAALVAPGANIQLTIPELPQQAKKEALEIARKTLTEFVTDKKVLPVKPIQNQMLYEPLGAFVTLKKNGQLRGCIGEFEPTRPLFEVIRDKTVAAASTDRRFSPVKIEELEQIDIEISVMTPRQKIDDWQKVKPGVDGVVLIQGNKMGTFLPQVATDNKWGPEKFLSELCSQKIGLPADCYKNPDTEIFTYQVQVFE